MMSMDEQAGDMQSALEFLAQHHEVKALTVNGMAILSAPEGVELHSAKPFLDSYLKLPERAIGFDTLTTPGSFIAHVARNAQPYSAIYASDDRSAPQFVAIYDEHDPNTAGTDGTPRHRGHGAQYRPALSDEFSAWTRLAKEGFVSPSVFAEFVEEHITDIVAQPEESEGLKALRDLIGGTWATPAKLMELSRGLQVNVAETVKSATSLSTGEISLVYEAQHHDSAGQQIRVPSLFAIGIPVFPGAGLYQIAIRLRYRINSGKLTWAVAPHQIDRVWRHAFDEMVDHIAQVTTFPVMLGKPDRAR